MQSLATEESRTYYLSQLIPVVILELLVGLGKNPLVDVRQRKGGLLACLVAHPERVKVLWWLWSTGT